MNKQFVVVNGQRYSAQEVAEKLTPLGTTLHPTRSNKKEADERYFHLVPREEGSVWNIEAEGRIRVVKNVTAFVRKDLSNGKYYVAYAECDERDEFNRAVGRNVARRKWFAKKRTALDAAGVNYETLLAKFENGEA
jgi:hypothetical protein